MFQGTGLKLAVQKHVPKYLNNTTLSVLSIGFLYEIL